MLKKIFPVLLLVAFFNSYSTTYTSVSDECPYIRFTGTTLQDIVVDKSNVKMQQTSNSVVVTFLNGGAQNITWSSEQARSYGYSLDSLYDHILSILEVTCGGGGGGGSFQKDTYANWITKRDGGLLPAGSWVEVTDRGDAGMYLFCTDSSNFTLSGYAGFYDADFNRAANYAGTGESVTAKGTWIERLEKFDAYVSAVTGTFNAGDIITNSNGHTATLISYGGSLYMYASGGSTYGDWVADGNVTITSSSGGTATITGIDAPNNLANDFSVCWNNRTYLVTNINNINGNAPDVNDDAYLLLAKSDTTGYILEFDKIDYDFGNDRFSFRTDKYNNTISNLSLSNFQFGDQKITNCYVTDNNTLIVYNMVMGTGGAHLTVNITGRENYVILSGYDDRGNGNLINVAVNGAGNNVYAENMKANGFSFHATTDNSSFTYTGSHNGNIYTEASGQSQNVYVPNNTGTLELHLFGYSSGAQGDHNSGNVLSYIYNGAYESFDNNTGTIHTRHYDLSNANFNNNAGQIGVNAFCEFAKASNIGLSLGAGHYHNGCKYGGSTAITFPDSLDYSYKEVTLTSSTFNGTVDITGQTEPDLSSCDYCGIIVLTSDNATETINKIDNLPTITDVYITPENGLSLTLTNTLPDVASTNDISLTKESDLTLEGRANNMSDFVRLSKSYGGVVNRELDNSVFGVNGDYWKMVDDALTTTNHNPYFKLHADTVDISSNTLNVYAENLQGMQSPFAIAGHSDTAVAMNIQASAENSYGLNLYGRCGNGLYPDINMSLDNGNLGIDYLQTNNDATHILGYEGSRVVQMDKSAASQNITNTDLTATGDHTTDWAHYGFEFDNIREMFLNSSTDINGSGSSIQMDSTLLTIQKSGRDNRDSSGNLHYNFVTVSDSLVLLSSEGSLYSNYTQSERRQIKIDNNGIYQIYHHSYGHDNDYNDSLTFNGRAFYASGDSTIDLGTNDNPFENTITNHLTCLNLTTDNSATVIAGFDGSGHMVKMDKTAVSNFSHTIFTPTTGQTISLINNQYNIVNPSGALLALTVNLPSSPSNNDVVIIKFTKAITTVTYGNGTVVGGITSPIMGTEVSKTFDSNSNSWY